MTRRDVIDAGSQYVYDPVTRVSRKVPDHCALASCRQPISASKLLPGLKSIKVEIETYQGATIKALVCSRECLETLLRELL